MARRLLSQHHTSAQRLSQIRIASKAGTGFTLLALFIFAFTSVSQPLAANMRVEDVVLVSASGKHKIQAEIADTPQTRARGLMFRRSLPADRGMLFLSKEPQIITMWMKNTILSLDMIFIRQDGSIDHIAEDTEPFSKAEIASKGETVAVLEMIAGSAKRLKLRPGDKVLHPFFASGK